MGYAKQLGKQYNAGTAWSSLGTDRSSYEQGSLGTHLANFRNISLPGFSEYATSGPRQSAPYEQNAMENVYGIYGNAKSKFNTPPVLLGNINNSTFGLLESFQGLPQGLNAAALAGKYAGFGR
jgi:hypothetical protein